MKTEPEEVAVAGCPPKREERLEGVTDVDTGATAVRLGGLRGSTRRVELAKTSEGVVRGVGSDRGPSFTAKDDIRGIRREERERCDG